MRIAIAEDSVLLREGVTRILDAAGFEVVASCDNADDLLMHVRSFPPDVVILDIRLPPTHNDEGMRAALHIREHHPGVGCAGAVPVPRARPGDAAAVGLGGRSRLSPEGSRSATSATSSAPSSALPRVVPPSIRRSSRPC